jgi:hypothetical protein
MRTDVAHRPRGAFLHHGFTSVFMPVRSASEPASSAVLAAAILATVERLGGHVSFVELCRDVDGFAGTNDYALRENLMLWQGVSAAASAALDDLQRTRRLAFVACDRLVYFLDGKTLRLPVGKRRGHAYRRPTWYPVTVSTPTQLDRHGSALRQARRSLRARA